MPHFHLSVQSGDDLILKRMKRRHSRVDTIAFCNEVRRLRPDAAFGADLIAGFPTETGPMFANTMALIDEAGLTYLHVFPFSARKGTPAARMPQVTRRVAKERAALLRAKGAERLRIHFESLLGSEQMLHIEEPGRGRTPCYAPVHFAAESPRGDILRVRITGATDSYLRAVALS
jgi:threonylcarbamoyladenosine tRNA methylthiotransferase MtaB